MPQTIYPPLNPQPVSVTGTVNTGLTTADLDTGAGTDTRAVVGLVYAASGGAVLVSASNPLPTTAALSGSVTADTELTTADLDTGAGTDTRAVVGLVYAASGGGVLVSAASPLPVTLAGGTLISDGSGLSSANAVQSVPMVYDGVSFNIGRSVAAGLNSAGAGLQAVGLVGQLDDVSTAAVSENQFAPVRISTRRAVLVEGVAGGTAQPVSIAATVAVDTELTTADLDTGAGTDTRAVVGLVYAASGGAVLVSAANPLPVTGTVTANQGGTWTVQPGNTANTTAWLVTGTGGTFPVTGTFWQATQPVSIAATVAVDTELAAALTAGDSMANQTTAPVIALGGRWDAAGAVWARDPAPSTLTLLSSAARTGSTDSAVQTNPGYRGVQVVLSVSSVPGAAPSLTLQIIGKAVNGDTFFLTASPTAVTAVGTYVYELYPYGSPVASGAGTPNVVQRTVGVLPKSWYATVTHGNANSVTYAVLANTLP